MWKKRLKVGSLSLLSLLVLGGCGGGGGAEPATANNGVPGGSAPAGGTTAPAPTPTPAPTVTLATLLTQPQDIAVTEGLSAGFSVGIAGTGPYTYQWLRDGAAISGANGATYQLAATRLADTGAHFSLVVTNAAGAVTSAAAALTVTPLPLSQQPQPYEVTALQGAPAVIASGVSGSAPLSAQWQRSEDGGANWTTLADANQLSLSIAKASWLDTALYRAVVSNPYGSVTTQPARLTVRPSLHALAGAVGGPGFVNGPAGASRLLYPGDAAVGADGLIYIFEPVNGVVRKLSSDGVLTIHATIEEPNPFPAKITIDAAGNLYFPVMNFAGIKKLSADRQLSVLAGGTYGFADGQGGAAKFALPTGISNDAAGNIYVADAGNNAIRKITPSGMVTTLLGAPGSASAGLLNAPSGLAVAANGDIYIADADNRVVRRLSSAGVLTTIAGQQGVAGTADGPAGVSQLTRPSDIAIDNDIIYVADANAIRKIDVSGAMSTVAGVAGQAGNVDGSGTAARFGAGMGLAMDLNHNVIVSDQYFNTVRRMTPSGTVSTLAGVASGAGSVNGAGASARFNGPNNIARGPSGAYYIADAGNNVVRKMDTNGNVSLFAGTVGDAGVLGHPTYLAVDSQENVYVADPYVTYVWKISPQGHVGKIAAREYWTGEYDSNGIPVYFHFPNGIVIDAADTIYVLASSAYYKVNADRSTTMYGPLASPGYVDGPILQAQFYRISAMVIDPATHDMYVADNYAIRKISAAGVVSTVAGNLFSYGANDGAGPAARFGYISSMLLDAKGNIFISDSASGIRKLSPSGYVTTLIGTYFSNAFVPIALQPDANGALSRVDAPAGLAWTVDGRLMMVSGNAVLVTE